MRTCSFLRRVVGRARFGSLLALTAVTAALVITAPSQAHGRGNPGVGGSGNRIAVGIRIGGGCRQDDWQRREYATGYEAGRCAGHQAGYADGRAGRAYCAHFTICAESHSRCFLDGYANGYGSAYACGYAEGQHDRRPVRWRRRW